MNVYNDLKGGPLEEASAEARPAIGAAAAARLSCCFRVPSVALAGAADRSSFAFQDANQQEDDTDHKCHWMVKRIGLRTEELRPGYGSSQPVCPIRL